ncbi:MAG: protein kinase [Acidobacteria bacterium]|nr:protein kinase [Acidobacteriota bacterium]
MTDVQWKRVWDLYEEAHALPAEDVRAFLDRLSDAPELVDEVRAILAAAWAESPVSVGEEPPAAWSHAGERLGRYEVVAPLGRGATAEVWVGRDTVLGRPVALKFVGAEHAGSDSVSKRFLREARAASALNHPNIVTVYEVVECGTPPSPVIVMELVEGSPLRKLCGQPLPEQQVRRIGGQIALALAEAHSRGIVHRDLKPENVMVRPDGYVKVLDFGLARTWVPSAGSGDVSSTAGLPVGTLRYMSPEQCQGKTADAASDVFSIGLVLYELCAGVHPFDAHSPLEIAHSIVWSEPKSPVAWCAVPESLRKLTLRMLAKDPGNRPSAVQVARELNGGLPDSQPESAAPAEVPHPPVPAGKARISRRRVVGGAATAAVAGAAVSGVRFWPKPDLWRAGTLISKGDTCDPAFSPDGFRLACSWKQPSSANFHIFLIRAAGGDPVQLTRGGSDEVGAAWSPDGTRLSFIRQGGGEDAVYMVSVESGKEQRIVTVSSNAFSGRVEWHSNQALIVSDEFGAAARRLLRLDLDTGQRQPLTTPPERTSDIAPRLSPDRKSLLFCRVFGEVRTDLFVLSAGGGEPRRLTFDELPKREIRWTPDGRGILFRAPRRKGWALWGIGLEGQPVREVLPLESLLAQFDVRPGSKGGLVLAMASTYATEAIWRAERPAGGGNFSDPVRFISSGPNGVDVNPVISPDGLRVAFVSLRSGSPQVWVSDNQGQNTRQLTNLQGGVQVTVPAWSPDSREIVCAARGTGVFVLDVSGDRAPRVVVEAEGTEPQFSTDGRSITFSSQRSGKQNLWCVPAGGGPTRQLTQDGGIIHRASRDGRWIYHVRRRQPGLWRIPVEGGTAQLVLDRVRSDLNRAWALGQSGGIYYTDYNPAAQQGTILVFDPVRGVHQPVCRFPMPMPTYTGTLSVAADERWLVLPMRETEDSGLSILPEIQVQGG